MTDTKYDVAARVREDVEIVKADVNKHAGIIPTNLAELTNMIISIHRANGDLSWLADVVADAEGPHDMSNYDINDYLP